jgi:hypothetical protein
MKIVEHEPQVHYHRCDNCSEIRPELVELDYRAAYDDQVVWICERCLRAALALIEAQANREAKP